MAKSEIEKKMGEVKSIYKELQHLENSRRNVKNVGDYDILTENIISTKVYLKDSLESLSRYLKIDLEVESALANRKR